MSWPLVHLWGLTPPTLTAGPSQDTWAAQEQELEALQEQLEAVNRSIEEIGASMKTLGIGLVQVRAGCCLWSGHRSGLESLGGGEGA